MNNINLIDGTGDMVKSIYDPANKATQILATSDLVDNVTTADATKVLTANQGVVLSGRITTLEDLTHEYEIWENIASGTSGTVTLPAHGTIVLDQYEGAGDCLIVKCDGTTGRPIDDIARTADGTIITGTLDLAGNYTLSGTPSGYPVALIFQIELAEKYKGELDNSRILNETTIPSADRTTFNNTVSLLSPSVVSVQDAIDDIRTVPTRYHGVVSLPTITDNLNGTVALGAGVVNFAVTANGDGAIRRMNTPATNPVTLTDNITNYVYANYNSGTPIIQVSTTPDAFLTDGRLVPLFRVIREGTDLHILDYDAYGLGLSDKMFFKDIALHSFERSTGLVLSTAPTRISTISAGTVWFGVQLYVLDVNTAGSSGELEEWYLVSGVWNKQTVTSYDSTYYSDGTNRLNLGVAKYVAKYFYRGIESDNHVYYMHGNQQNSVADALAEAVPIAPSVVTSHSMYVGKIVIQQNATNGIAYPRAWEGAVQSANVVNHDDLANIQQAGTGVLNGHVSSSAQTIAGIKSFTDNPIIRNDTNPTLFLRNNSINQAESGRIRFIEQDSSFQGAYFHYDGLNNIFQMGVHELADTNSANDVPTISVSRTNNEIAIGTIFAPNTTSTSTRILSISGRGIDSANSRGNISLINDRTTVTAGDICGDIFFLSNLNGTTPTSTTQIVGAMRSILTGTGGTNGFGGDILFYTKSDNVAGTSERVRLTSAGLLGIGLTPLSPIHVYRVNSNDTTENRIQISRFADGRGVSFMQSYRTDTSSDDLMIAVDGANSNDLAKTKYRITSNGEHRFYGGTTSTELARFTSTGEVSIGTTGQILYNYGAFIGVNTQKMLTAVNANEFIGLDGGTDYSRINFATLNSSSSRTILSSIRSVVISRSNNVEQSDLAFYTKSGAISTPAEERLRITSAGNVGIGTTSPSGKFHIVDTTLANSALFERSGQTVDSVFAALRVLATKTTDMGDNFGPLIAFNIKDDAGVANSIGYIGAVRAGGDTFGDLVFRTTNNNVDSEKMRITSAGNVGVGVTSPSGKIHAVDSAFTNTAIFERSGQTVDNIRCAVRTLATKTTDMGEGFGSSVGFSIRDDAGTMNTIGYIGAIRGDADNTGDLLFLPVTAGTEISRMRITSTGNVVLGSELALATNATNGFTYIPTQAGAPTGVPTAYTGKVAMSYDTTNNKLYIYNGGWKSVTLA